jgi:hypothetical protein
MHFQFNHFIIKISETYEHLTYKLKKIKMTALIY